MTDRPEPFGCSDPDCIWLPRNRGGIGTNGGCHCLPLRMSPIERDEVKQKIRWLVEEVERLGLDLAESVATLNNEQGRGDPPCAIPVQAHYHKGGEGWHVIAQALGGFHWVYYCDGQPFITVYGGGTWMATRWGIVEEGPPQMMRASKPTCRQAMRESYAAMGKHAKEMQAYFERTYNESRPKPT